MKPRVLLALAAMLACSAGAAWWWHGVRWHTALLIASIPPCPDLAGWPAELSRRIQTNEQRLRLGDDPVAALGELSRLYHANGFLTEACRCYSGLEQIEPREPRWLHRHATILGNFGDSAGARVRWFRVTQLAPRYVPARLRLGDLEIKADRFEAARGVYESVRSLFPEEPYALLGLARCAVQAGRWGEARPLLERLVAQTDFNLGYDLLVTVYEKLGLSAEAAGVRGRARIFGNYRDPPDPWLLELDEDCYDAYTLALASGAAARTGDRALAVRRLERAIALAPDHATLYLQYGRQLIAERAYSGARTQLESCVRIDCRQSDAWALLSALHETVGDRSAADRALVEGLRWCPDSPGLHLSNARRLVRDGQLAAAIDEFQTTIRLRPSEADAYLALATTLLQLGRVVEAMQSVDQALAAEPEHPDALVLRSLFSIATDDERVASQWIRRALNQSRTSGADQARMVAAYRERFGQDFR